jgi:hypothetical protein
MATNSQYDSPPFDTSPQDTGMPGTSAGSSTNDQYSQDNGLGASAQHGSGAENLGSQNPGQPRADNGEVSYTDPFAILGAQGSQTPQATGSTSSVPSYSPPVGSELTDTGLGSGTASAPAPGRGSAPQTSPWTKAGA